VCLSDVVRLVEVSADGSAAVGEGPYGPVDVSLLVLTMDGVQPVVGDWIVVTTGLAVELLSEEEAVAVTRARREMKEGVP